MFRPSLKAITRDLRTFKQGYYRRFKPPAGGSACRIVSSINMLQIWLLSTALLSPLLRVQHTGLSHINISLPFYLKKKRDLMPIHFRFRLREPNDPGRNRPQSELFRADALVNFFECRSTFESIEHTIRANFSLRTVELPLWVSRGASGVILKLWN